MENISLDDISRGNFVSQPGKCYQALIFEKYGLPIWEILSDKKGKTYLSKGKDIQPIYNISLLLNLAILGDSEHFLLCVFC